MNRRMLKWCGIVLSLGLLAVLLPGCLVSIKTVSAAYDAPSDQFRFLSVYQQIRGDKPENQAADEKWLTALYANRANLILLPHGSPSFFQDLGETAILRLADLKYAEVPLSQAPQKGLESQAALVALDDITVLPGRFFLRGPDNLCYYHQIIVPGKTADAVLAYLNGRLSETGKDSIVAAIDQELARRQGGGTWMTWQEFTRQCIDQSMNVLGSSSSTTQPAPSTTAPLDTQSLQLLRDALASGKMPLVRRADQVFVEAPLTEADVTGLVGFVEACRSALGERLDHPAANEKPDTQNTNRMLRRLMNCASVTAADKTHAQATIDLIALFNSFDDPVQTSAMVDKGSQAAGRRMAELAAKQLDLDEGLTVEQVAADFKSGTLKAYPPAPAVQPGAGLGEIRPATQPAK